MPFRWWHKSSPQPPGVSQGDTLCVCVGFAGHLYESGFFMCSALRVLSVIEKDLIPVRNLVYPFDISLQSKKNEGSSRKPWMLYIQAFLMSFRPYILWSAGQHGHGIMNDLWCWSHKQVHSGKWQAIYSILNLQENITLLAVYIGPVLILLVQLGDLRNISSTKSFSFFPQNN